MTNVVGLSDTIKRVVVIGNSGFVGHRMQEYLTERYPALRVIGLSSRDIDLTDVHQSDRLLEHFGLDTAVIMCAGIKSNFGSNVDNYEKNVAMAANVCRAIGKRPVRRLIFFSSIAVYGVDKHNTRITEGTEATPDTHYGLSKYDSETLFSLEFRKLADSSLVILRAPTMYGPNEKIVAATPSGFLITYLEGGEVTLFGDGAEQREFLFIDDVAKVVDNLLHGSFAGVLNIGAGRAVSYREALDTISRLLNKKLVVRHLDRTKASVDKIYDTTLLRATMPDLTPTSLDDGLRLILLHRQSGDGAPHRVLARE